MRKLSIVCSAILFSPLGFGAAAYAQARVSAAHPGEGEDDGWLRGLLPESWQSPIGGENSWIQHRVPDLEYWQPFALAMIIVAGMGIDRLVRMLVRVGVKRLMKSEAARTKAQLVAHAVRPLGVIGMGLFWYFILPMVELPQRAETVTQSAIHVVLIFAAVWAAFRMIDLSSEVLEAKAEETESKLDDVLVPLLRTSAKIAAVVFGVGVGIATLLDVNIGQILLSVSAGAVVFGLAAKDSLENFFGTVTIILDRPFDIGDYINIDGKVEGTVEELGFRSTRLRTPQNSLVTVPNGTLIRTNVENIQRRRYRRWRTTLRLALGTPPERLLAFSEGVRELVRMHPYTRKDAYQVFGNEFGAASLDVLMDVFFEVPDSGTELRERERLFTDILRLAARLGVALADPTQPAVQRTAEGAAPLGMVAGCTDGQAQMAGIGAAHAVTAGQPWLANRPGPCVLPQKSDYPENCGDPAKA